MSRGPLNFYCCLDLMEQYNHRGTKETVSIRYKAPIPGIRASRTIIMYL